MDFQKKQEKYKQEAQADLKKARTAILNDEAYLNQRTVNLKANEDELEKERQRIFAKGLSLDAEIDKYQEKQQSVETSLLEIANLTKAEAQERVLTIFKKNVDKDAVRYLQASREKARHQGRSQAMDIIFQALERYASEAVNEKTTNVVELPNNEMKGRIIGKEGRNLRTFEKLAGVEIIIDDSPNIATVSCFDPIRRAIASEALQALVNDGRIQPVRIEEILHEKKNAINEMIEITGINTIEDLGLTNVPEGLVKTIGRLKYRTSYYQNVLLHSIEVAKLSRTMAAELNLDEQLAARAGLLHDIGKAVDFEAEGSHVKLGVKIATEYDERPEIINAIAAHHDDCKPNSPYGFIVRVADTLSAARPGARLDSVEKYIERMKTLEKICREFAGVKEAYVYQAGRQIRVFVNAKQIDDNQCEVMTFEIKQAIQKQKTIPGDITVTVVREYRVSTTIV